MRILGIAAVQMLMLLSFCGMVTGMEYPKEIAAELPACKGANIMQTMNIQGNMVVMMECAGKMEDVYNTYKKKVESSGWSIMMETKQAEASILMGEKGPKHLVLNVSTDGSQTLVNITLGKRN